jgi:hypothetical protein
MNVVEAQRHARVMMLVMPPQILQYLNLSVMMQLKQKLINLLRCTLMMISMTMARTCICLLGDREIAENDIARVLLHAGGPHRMRDDDKLYFLQSAVL